MAIYQPYFYIIQDKRNGIYYAGAKWAQDADPTKLMMPGGYLTSSGTIKAIIEQHGISSFVIRKIRLFETTEHAQDYETRFLRKVNARNHPKFYNGHNNDGAMNVAKMKLVMLELYGDANYTNREKAKETTLKRFGVENVFQPEDVRKRCDSRKEELYGDPNYNNREKAKRTTLEMYGVEWTLQSIEIREASKRTKQDKYGDPNYNNRIGAKETWFKKYGEVHPNKTDRNRKILKEAALNREQSKSNREVVFVIKKYQRVYGKELKLGRAWFRKSDEYLNNIVRLLEEKYGVL
jgi:hypothetical protein